MSTAKTTASLLLCTFVVAAAAAGDPLTDLRATLHRYPATQRFSASASVEVKGDAKDDGGARAGSTSFEVESGPTGFVIRVLPDTLSAAGKEAESKKRDPDNTTPTRTAMVALSIFDVIDAVDTGAMLLNELNGATLVERTPCTLAGKPATLLRIKVKPTLASTHSRFVKEPAIELRVWVGANGIPIVAERDSNYSASLVVIRAANVRKERWLLAVAADRLFASRTEEENRASVAGKSVVSIRSVMYTMR